MHIHIHICSYTYIPTIIYIYIYIYTHTYIHTNENKRPPAPEQHHDGARHPRRAEPQDPERGLRSYISKGMRQTYKRKKN